MNHADDFYPVEDWDGDAWDDVILNDTRIGRAGCFGNWVMYTPGRLIVSAAAEREDRVRELLKNADASLARSYDADADADAEIAARLGLALYNAPDDRLVALVAQIREIVPQGASLDHVLTAGAQRWGGDDEPKPIDPPKGLFASGEVEVDERVRVAILDTGIAEDVPFRIEHGPDDLERPDDDGNDLRDKPAGHGTHVAGIIAAVAPTAKLVAHRMLEGVAGVASEWQVAKALLKAADADIINCSFSGPTLNDAAPVVIENALAQLKPGTVVVACAGNLDTDRPQWPAACKGVIAVAAVGRDSETEAWRRAEFSDYGPWVDCAAPGVRIASTFLHWPQEGGIDPVRFHGFASWSGTSMSCPKVTGAIAALALREGINVKEAAYRLVHDPDATPRVAQLGPVIA